MLRALIDRFYIKKPRLRRLVTRALYGRAVTEVDLLGAGLFIHSELENGYLRAFRRTRTMSLFRDEASVLVNLATLIGDDCSFVDAGANIGIFSSILSRLCALKRNFRVFAFEADPRTFERLSRNAQRHGFDARNIALTQREGVVEFVRGAVSHVTTRSQSANSYNIPGETFQAICRPLASFEIPGNAIVIKIDVEGAEYEVLLGAEPLFQQGRVKAVYFDGVEKPGEIRAFLEKYGFRLLCGRTLKPLSDEIFSLLAVRAADLP